MAIGVGGESDRTTTGKGYITKSGAELDRSRLGGNLPGKRDNESWDDYWLRMGSGNPGNPTDFMKNFVPPDPIGDYFLGELDAGSLLPGGGGRGGIGDKLNALFKGKGGGGGGGAGGPVSGGPAGLGGAPQVPPMGMFGVGGSGDGVGQFEGLDFTKRGALEQYQLDTRDYFRQPTLSEMFAKDAISKGGANVTNRAEEAYQNFMASSPQNMDPYYENERRKAMEAINKTMAARGSYGSTAANDMIGEAYTNLAADAAMKNAQYGLQRSGLMGSLAQGADQSSLAGSSDKRNWTSLFGNLAGQGDASSLARVLGGASVAGGAQGAQRTRGQDAFMNQLMMGDRMAGILGSGYGNIFASDMDLFKTGVGLNTGTAAEGYNQASNNAVMQRQNVANFNNLLGGNLQMGKGLYDMFNTPSPGSQPAQTPSFSGPPPSQNYGTSNYYRP